MRRDQLTSEQLAEMGYTRWERAITFALRSMLLSVVVALCSFFILNPMLDTILPGNGFEHSFRVNVITLGLAFLSLAVGMLFAVAAYICAVILLPKLNPINSYRLRLPLIGILVSGIFAVIILLSLFIDYGPVRAWVSAIAGVILVVCIIASYRVYYVRFRRTAEVLIEATQESRTEK